MFVLSRAAARRFRTLLRRSVLAAAPRGPCPTIVAMADSEAITLQAVQGNVGLSLQISSSPGTSGQMAFPGELLATVEGPGDSSVSFDLVMPTTGRAQWDDKGVPRVVEFDIVPADKVPARLPIPKRFITLPPTFLEVLDDACRTAARLQKRHAIDHVQLCGKTGNLVATDGKQLLLQGGFRWPFAEDLLVPAIPLFSARELHATADTVRLGRAQTWVVVQSGPWSVHLEIDSNSRFPDVQRVIPAGPDPTRLLLDEADAQFLIGALPGLPGGDDEYAPITLDMGEQAFVRAGFEQKQTEVLLQGATVGGMPLRSCLNRNLLLRALRLGFRAFEFHGPNKPLLAREGERLFVAVMLDAKSVLPPTAERERIGSAATGTNNRQSDRAHVTSAPRSINNYQPDERKPTMSNVSNGNNGPAPEPAQVLDPLEEAEALRSTLQEAHNRVSRLIASLRQFRKQRKVVESAVASLRQFHLTP
jgi:hypothetical protein